MSETQSALERLTPPGWKHVGIYPAGELYDLRGRHNSTGWSAGDLTALKIKPQKASGLNLVDALSLGERIEKAMGARADGTVQKPEPKRRAKAEKPPVKGSSFF